jgi:hypothetical protein
VTVSTLIEGVGVAAILNIVVPVFVAHARERRRLRDPFRSFEGRDR